MKRNRWRLLLLLAFGALLLIAIFPWAAEPKYRGRRLSEWLLGARLHNGKAELPYGHAEAVRQIGTNSLPFLLKWIAYEPPAWHRWLPNVSALSRFRATMRNEDWRAKRAYHAVVGFWVLGPQASGAIPELTRLMDSTNQNYRGWASCALCGIGKDAIPALLDFLTNRPAHSNYPAMFLYSAWYNLGTNATVTTPVLIEHLRDRDAEVAETSAQLLGLFGSMKTEPETVVPALCENIDYTNATVRYAAVQALSNFGNRAHCAVPLLIQALEGSDKSVREAATNTLNTIAPEVLKSPRHGHEPVQWDQIRNRVHW